MLFSAFLFRVVVKAALNLGVANSETSLPSSILSLILIIIIFASPTLAFPLVTICYSIPFLLPNPILVAKLALIAVVKLRALIPFLYLPSLILKTLF